METRLFRNAPAYTLNRDTAPAMWLVGTLWLIHATGIQTNNRASVIEQVMPQGLGPPAHRHPLAVEGFYVLEGAVDFQVDGQRIRAEAGTLLHLPRMIPHTFTVESAETRVLNFYAPAGSEMHVIHMARPAEERRRPTMAESAPPQSDETNQILSRLYGSVGVAALPFSVPPSADLLATDAGAWRAGALKVATAQDAPRFDAFELRWRLHASGAETGNAYDLFEVGVAAGKGMPTRILGSDEAIYVSEGAISIAADGQTMEGRVGSFTYVPAGGSLQWRAAMASRLLVFHFPGGFDRALAGGRGQDALVAAWLEADGTRFLNALPFPETAVQGDRNRSALSAKSAIHHRTGDMT